MQANQFVLVLTYLQTAPFVFPARFRFFDRCAVLVDADLFEERIV